MVIQSSSEGVFKEGYRVRFLRNEKGKIPSSRQGLSLITSSSILFKVKEGEMMQM